MFNMYAKQTVLLRLPSLFHPTSSLSPIRLNTPGPKDSLRQQEVSGADPETFQLLFLIQSAEPLSLGNPPALQVHAELLF